MLLPHQAQCPGQAQLGWLLMWMPFILTNANKVLDVILPFILQMGKQKLRVFQSFSEAAQPVSGRMPAHLELPT